MNLIESYCKHKYYNLSNSEKILKKIQEKIDSSRTCEIFSGKSLILCKPQIWLQNDNII